MIVDLWYVLVCATFAAYVALDGYDLGAGVVSPFVARTDEERRAVLHTILPYWDGNEVFLLAGGATLYLAFPRLFPAFVSGFYLPVMIVLWLLVGRGLGIEMRHKLDQPLWNQLWDGVFFLSSTLLVIVFGAALGNVVRGVSVDEHGDFFAPLWTSFFDVGPDVGILDWYTVTIGLTALIMIARHGAVRIVMTVDDDRVRTRAGNVARWLFGPALASGLAASLATFRVQPLASLSRLALVVLALIAFGGLVGSFVTSGRRAYGASTVSIVAFFACAAVTIHPWGLVARVPERSVLATDAAAGAYSLGVGLAWWIPGMALVIAYSLVSRRMSQSRDS